MKRPSPVLLALIAAAAGCSAPASQAILRSPARQAPGYIRVGHIESNGDRQHSVIRRVALEDYVQATIISEFAPTTEDSEIVGRMLEVQAVVGRTYALAHLGRHEQEAFDLCATTHCQLYQPSRLKTSRWAAAAARAAHQTFGSVLWFRGAAANVLFHADCGGRTSNATEVWGGTGHPYLAGFADDGPAAAAHTTWRYEATREAVMGALNVDPRTRIGTRLDGITVLDRDSAGRAQRVGLHAQHERIVRGDTLREVLTRAFGARAVRSTWFEVRRQRGKFIFEGRGFGHGVGLCQAGALARIRAGAPLPEVLQRYFPGTTLVSLH